MAPTATTTERPLQAICSERAYVISSTKMHLSVLRAQLLHLSETGSVPKDIENSVSDLRTTIPGLSKTTLSSPIKSREAALKILKHPLVISVKDDYVSQTIRGVLADRGDRVVVFAYNEHGNEAIAYNARNKTAGRFPAKLLDKEASELFPNSKMYLATSDMRDSSVTHVEWKAGQYIRVWDMKVEKHTACTGYCFVLATGKIGQFRSFTSLLSVLE